MTPPEEDYQLKRQSICIGERSFELQTLSDNQQFSDPQGIAELAGIPSSTWSLFGQIYPSSIFLARVLAAMDLAGLRILEVGAGIGLPSMSAAAKGADVTFSDYHHLSEVFLKKNVELNGLPDIKFACLDWKNLDTDIGQFDLIVGSDVLYEPNHPQLLADFIHLHAKPRSTALLVDPGRKLSSQFTRRMEEHGFDCDKTHFEVEILQDTSCRAHLLSYARSVAPDV